MSTDLRDIQPLTGLLMGASFLLAGTMILFVALGWIRVDPETIHAPSWVLGVCGGMFAFTGVAVLYYGVVNSLGLGARSREGANDEFAVVAWLLGLVISGGLAVTASWIAFGPGERAFSGSVGIGGFGMSGSAQSETFGRWVFGIGAVLVGSFAIWGLIYGIREIAVRRRRDDR